MEKIFSLVILLVVSGYAFSQDDDQTCHAFVDCLKAVETVHEQCGPEVGRNDEPNQPNADACVAIPTKSAHLQQLLSEFRQVQIHCVSRGLQNARPVGDEKTQEQCRTAVSDFRSGTSRSNIEVVDNTAEFEINARLKRENLHLIKASFDNSTDESRDKVMGMMATTTSTTTVTSTTEQQSSSGATEREATAAPIVATNAQTAECHKSVEAKQKLCKPLAACCSEAILCDLKYHLSSPLHNKVYQAKINLLEARQRCMNKRRTGQLSAPVADVNRAAVTTTTTSASTTTSPTTTTSASTTTTPVTTPTMTAVNDDATATDDAGTDADDNTATSFTNGNINSRSNNATMETSSETDTRNRANHKRNH